MEVPVYRPASAAGTPIPVALTPSVPMRALGTPQPAPATAMAPPPQPSPAVYAPTSGHAYSSAASAAVASAVLSNAGVSPSISAAHRLMLNGGAASLKSGAHEAVAVLTGRLAEATAALADAPIREAGIYVTMIKDIALAIASLKALP